MRRSPLGSGKPSRTRTRSTLRPGLVTLTLATLATLGAPAARGQLQAAGSQLWHQDVAGVAGVAEAGDALGAALVVGDFNGDKAADLAIGAPGESVGTVPGAGSIQLLLGGMPGGLDAAAGLLFHQNTTGVPGVAEEGDGFGEVLACGDFDQDGFDDLAIGIPGEGVEGGGAFMDGAVIVLYGSDGDALLTRGELWSQSSPGVSGDSEPWDFFGHGLAAGDFDGDGFDDLAIGIPGETFEGWGFDPAGSGHGRVVVLFGTAQGLSSERERDWHQDSWQQTPPEAIDGSAEKGDLFGWTLAAGNFDGDAFDDLAVGVPGENDGRGVVNVLYGSDTGLNFARNKIWEQGADGIEEVREADDAFGRALVAADFDGDGRDDLAVGVPGEDVGPEGSEVIDAGTVNVLYGSDTGITASGNQAWHQDVAGVFEVAEAGDRFGDTLTACDFDGLGFHDLAIGAPGELLPGGARGGVAQVLYGTEFGLLLFGNQVWHQDVAGVADAGEVDDAFGAALACGAFDGTGADDLAIGVPGEGLGKGREEAGAVHVLLGSP